jgi:hypothetical protein
MNAEDARNKTRPDKMTTHERESAKEIVRHKQEALNSRVREQLLVSLGKPADLLSVQVRPLWGANLRANVFVGSNITCAKITHSFFLLTDDDGNILKSTPRMMRVY